MKTSSLFLCLGAFTVLLSAQNSDAATVRAIQTGNWESTATWQFGTLPVAGDSIVILGSKIVTITSMIDLSSAPSRINIHGQLNFQNGKKLTLSAGSLIYIQVEGNINPGGGGGNSNTIHIGANMVWNTGMGPLAGYQVLPASPLPVELIGFKAVATSGNMIHITWETATEVNNDYFEIERSSNGNSFDVIGKLAGHGTTSNTSKYLFTDHDPLKGDNYYRLRQVDYDSHFNYSAVVLCRTENKSKGVIQLFPNPTRGDVFITVADASNESYATVMIADSKANVIYKEQLQLIPGSRNLQLSNDKSLLKPGIYIVTVTINEDVSRNQLMVY